MHRLILLATLTLGGPILANADETFVTIHKVIGSRIAVSKETEGGRGRRGDSASNASSQQAGSPRGRGRGRTSGGAGTTASQPIIVTVPATAKITSAMRERRTFEFRIGAELAGGMRNRIFQNTKEPLSARIVTTGNRITEINVITDQTDINQSNTDSSGQAVIAIRPKRPPMKRK